MSRSTTNGKAECIQCGKSKSAVRCEGCLQTFCYNHLADHRQELSKQLDEIETDRDLFRQTLNLYTPNQQKHTLIQQIDHWKEESIQKIEQTADECKKSVLQYITEQIQQVEINLSKLTEDLRYVRQENDYNEADLLQLSTELKQLTEELEQPANIIIEQNSASPVNNITIVVSSPKQVVLEHNESIATSSASTVQSMSATGDTALPSKTKQQIPATSSIPCTPTNSTPQATPIAFFSVNEFDHVIIYFDQTYQHHMIYTCSRTLHFLHSDCYELFHIQQKQNYFQQENNNNANIIDSVFDDMGSFSINNANPASALSDLSTVNSKIFGSNELNPSTTPLLGQVIDKEYCQAKKSNNRFNVPLGTKFFRVRVKPWKPSAIFSSK